MKTVELGNTGLYVSRLGFGTGTHGWSGRSDQTALGLQELADLLRYGYDRGITFWDSADQYGSHPHVARALSGLDRDRVVIVTKICARTAADAEKDVERCLRELRTDRLDIVLMHCMSDRDWPETRAGVMEVLERKKEEGVLRAHGVSIHDLGALERAAETPWNDVVLARINYAGTNMDGPPEKVVPILERMDEAGIGVYGMKVIGCGKLDNTVRDAIHFVLDLPAIDAITMGMKSREEVDENLGWVEAHDRSLQPA